MYNGYKNYPTWVTNLWLSNEQSSYNYWTDRAKEIFETAKKVVPREDVHRRAVRILADELEGCHKAGMPETSGVYCDLLTWALNQVDWFQVAENLIEDE